MLAAMLMTAVSAEAQTGEIEQEAALVHVGYVLTRFEGTPKNMGLMPTAIAEAKIAVQHVNEASMSPDDLANIKLHVAHVLHALDPAEEPKGPGLGFGTKPATLAIIDQIRMAASAGDASPTIQNYAPHVWQHASNAVGHANTIIALAKRIRATASVELAEELVNQMRSAANRMLGGPDDEGALLEAEHLVRLLTQ
jgi:hypothetical protein